MEGIQHLIPTSLFSDTFDPRWHRSIEALPVIPDSFHLWQSQLFRPPSYGGLGHARTNDCQQCEASYQQYEYNDDLSKGLPVINNTRGKMTGVVDDLCLLTCVDDHLCGLFTRWQNILFTQNIFRSGIYLRLFTCRGIKLSSSIVIVSDEELSCRLDTIDFFPYVVVSLVISIGQNIWLDGKWSSSEISSG